MSMNYLMRRRTISSFCRLSRLCVCNFNGQHRSLFILGESVVNDVGKAVWRNFLNNSKCSRGIPAFSRGVHSSGHARASSGVGGEVNVGVEEGDGAMNDFLSRFVAIMRGKICEVYPDCDKAMVDGMLIVIVQNVVSEMEKGGIEHMLNAPVDALSPEFSEDLWRTVWEVSNMVLDDMEKERRKEKMKNFLLCEEVTQMCKFAGEIGIRGDMLRELRFKWAKEKMEETDLYKKLEKVKQQYDSEFDTDAEDETAETMLHENNTSEQKSKVVSLPKRRGNINFKIYGLDLSDPMWNKAADVITKAEGTVWPQEPKQITGKCKLTEDKILNSSGDDFIALLAEYKELLEPNRIDWLNLLNKLKERNPALHFKVAEYLLNEETFHATVHDYSTLIDMSTKSNRVQDAEVILQKMNDNGIDPDMLTTTILIGLYSNVGNLESAKKAFKSLRSYGFLPDANVYKWMILAYVKAGEPKEGELLIREMEARDMKPTREMYMALLESFSEKGDVGGANQIANTMQFSGFELTVDCFALLIEAYSRGGDAEQARAQFDYMMKLGCKPDDRTIASVVRAYERTNQLDQALGFLLQLEKNGTALGTATYTVLVDWMAKMQLVEEAEELLGKISEQGEAPPFEIQVILCAMYARAGVEKKTLQALGALRSKEEKLSAEDFERIIGGLIDGGFKQEADRLISVMKGRGFQMSESLSILSSLPRTSMPRRPKLP